MAAPAVAGMVLQGIGGGIKAFGQIQAGEQKYKIAKMQASSALFEGRMQNLDMQTNAWKWKQQSFRVKSQQIVSGAAAGITLDSESFQNITNETMAAFNEDVQTMLTQGRIAELFGSASATMAKAEGRMQRAAGYMSALTTGINTAAGMMKTWGGTES